jgi:hypothetical protein
MSEAEAMADAKKFAKIGPEATKFQSYQLPGGENYREILLKLPDEKQRFWAKNGQGVERIFNDPDEASRFAGSSGDARAVDSETVNRMRNQYHSSHWENEPNVLAHMRVQDRKGPNGEKILHVEEIQSDWHQAGRKKGYKPDDYIEQSNALDRAFNDLVVKRAELKDEAQRIGYFGEGAQALTDEANSITPQLMKLQEQRDELQNIINYGVPDAPFKKNWHELAMKRLLNYAADNGYDSIAITPGAEQASRFSLSKQLNEVRYDPRTGNLVGEDHNGKMVIARNNVTKENLPEYIGKEGAQKVLEMPVDEYGVHALRGADLEVGGEGMKGFYDKMLPDYLNAFGKPYGSQVSTLNMTSSRGAPQIDEIQRLAGINQDQWRAMTGDQRVQLAEEIKNKVNAGGMPLHNFPITPEMRESIKQKGLPLYQQVGIPTAGAGAASQAIQPEEELGLSGGGIINSAIKQAHLAKLAKMRQEMTPRAEAVKALISKDENSYLRDVVPNSLTNESIESEIARMKARAEAAQPEVKEAKGGVVRMTKNRDAMFMELSNKKLKRK